jgi:hypothetical protein
MFSLFKPAAVRVSKHVAKGEAAEAQNEHLTAAYHFGTASLITKDSAESRALAERSLKCRHHHFFGKRL